MNAYLQTILPLSAAHSTRRGVGTAERSSSRAARVSYARPSMPHHRLSTAICSCLSLSRENVPSCGSNQRSTNDFVPGETVASCVEYQWARSAWQAIGSVPLLATDNGALINPWVPVLTSMGRSSTAFAEPANTTREFHGNASSKKAEWLKADEIIEQE